MSTINRKVSCTSISPAFFKTSRPKSNLIMRRVKTEAIGILADLSAVFGQVRRQTIKYEVELREQTAWLREMEDFDRF